jgi:hypothetical protein
VRAMGGCFDLRKFRQQSTPDEVTDQQHALKAIYQWAVTMGGVKLPAFTEMWRQHLLLSERLCTAYTDVVRYRERWSPPDISGTVIMKDLFTEEKMYSGAPDWLYLFNHCALKTVNEAVVESMGSMLDRHAVGSRGLPMAKYVAESIIHWNAPVTGECEPFLVRALNLHFKGGPWHFTSHDEQQRYSKFSVSEVLDRLAETKSRLPFLV